MNSEAKTPAREILECEKPWIFSLLMLVGGFFGGFTYSIRGGVFCNAQTANFLLFAMAITEKQWGRAVYYLIPMSAYLLGALLSELLPTFMKRFHLIRWDTLFVMIEIVVVIFLACLPETAPFQITQCFVNFICAMQYNTFRQTMNYPAATTFVTNHWRQVGIQLAKIIRHRNGKYLPELKFHLWMIMLFLISVGAATLLCKVYHGQSILITLIPLFVILADFLKADLGKEHDVLEQIPQGHS